MTKEERWVTLFEEVIGRMPSADERERGRATGFDFKQIEAIANAAVPQQIPNGFALSKMAQSPQVVQSDQVNHFSQKRAIWIEHFQQFLHREPTIEELIVGEDSAYDLSTIHQFLEPNSTTPSHHVEHHPVQRNLLIALIFLLVLGISSYLYGLKYCSRTSVASRYIAAVEKGDGNKALAYEAWSDNQEDIDESALSYITPESPIERSIENVTDHLVRTGNTWLVFPKWRIMVDPITYVISSNTDGLTIDINGVPFVSDVDQQVMTTDSSQAYKAFRLYPSTYVFEAKGQVDNEDIDISYTSSIEELKSAYSAQELSDGIPIELNLTHLNTRITSNLKDGDVYIDEQKVGSLKDGELKLSNIAAVGTSHVYIRKNFKDQTYLESTLQKVNEMEGQSEVKLDAKVLTNDLAKQVLETAFSKLSYPQMPSNLEESFEGGSDNSFYSNVNATVERNTTKAESRAAKTVNMRDVKIKSIKQTSATRYEVTFTFVYDIYYEPASQFQNSGSILDTMEWSAEIDFQGDTSSENLVSNYRILGQLSEAKKLNNQNNLK